MPISLRQLAMPAAGLLFVGCASVAEDSGEEVRAADTSACAGTAGTFHDQAFVVGGETRHYYLHVPPDYGCSGQAWPLLVDFHGTGFGGENDTVEESWATPELVSVSDAEHFIVVRPRSLSQPSDGGSVFQWDIHPGDLAKNRAFAEALVQDLERRYHVDPARVYTSGFSNGPTMASQFLADERPLFHGFILVAGGLNEDLARASSFPADAAPRVYATTGYRDYMLSAQYRVLDFLAAHGLPAGNLWKRESDTGHELYDWHFREGFRWVDQGRRPAAGALATAWSRDPSFNEHESLTEVRRDPSGALHAVGANGSIYRKASDGAWTRTASISTGLAGKSYGLSDICFLPTGEGFAAGGISVESTTDGRNWSVEMTVPEFGPHPQFGYTHATAVGCGGNRVIAAGVWSAATKTTAAGSAWSEASILDQGYSAFMTAVRQGPTGTWIGIGYYDYIGRSTDGVTFTAMAPPTDLQWHNGVAAAPGGRFWIVGEKGSILASADDGLTWAVQAAPRAEDLYAVGFAPDGLRGVAVGAHGTAFRTSDGGATWLDDSTGLDGFLGGVEWIDDHTVVVVGESGTVLTRSL
jgi:poly(3-hydroxybutyrate) depolymerase/photosystem II stability/assembly factor-like uncharacterized protein